MQEYNPDRFESESLSLDEKVEEFFAAVERHSNLQPGEQSNHREGYSYGPPNGDATILAQARSMVKDRDILEPVIRDGFKLRDDIQNPLTPVMYPYLVYRAEWKAVRGDDPEGWARGDYLSEEAWQAARRRYLPDPNNIHEFQNPTYTAFSFDIGIRNVASNPGTREGPLHLVAAAFPELFPPGQSILEVGSGPMHILRVLAAGMRIGRMAVVRAETAGWNDLDIAATERANQYLAEPLQIGPSTGIDIVDYNLDKVWREWPKECTIRPVDEMAAPSEVRLSADSPPVLMTPRQLYEYIDELDLSLLKFMRIDLTDESDAATLRQDSRLRGIRGYDGIFYPTVLQQQMPHMRQSLMEGGRAQARRGGWEAVQDFAWPDPGDPSQLVFAHDIYEREGSYSLNIKDKKGNWQQMLVMQNDRCQTVKLGLGRLSIGRKSYSLADRLG
jgi:hypothetical protein